MLRPLPTGLALRRAAIAEPAGMAWHALKRAGDLAITRELELLGSFRFHDEMNEVLAALAEGSLDVDAVITHEYPASEAVRALEEAANAAASGKVLLTFD